MKLFMLVEYARGRIGGGGVESSLVRGRAALIIMYLDPGERIWDKAEIAKVG